MYPDTLIYIASFVLIYTVKYSASVGVLHVSHCIQLHEVVCLLFYSLYSIAVWPELLLSPQSRCRQRRFARSRPDCLHLWVDDHLLLISIDSSVVLLTQHRHTNTRHTNTLALTHTDSLSHTRPGPCWVWGLGLHAGLNVRPYLSTQLPVCLFRVNHSASSIYLQTI